MFRNRKVKFSMKNIFHRNQMNMNMNTKNGLTNEKIYDKKIVSKGSSGDNVLELQKCLNKLSKIYPAIPQVKEDSIFGDKTHEAVLAFQGLFNLITDGVVGRYTWTALYEAIKQNISPINPDIK